jgi:transposase
LDPNTATDDELVAWLRRVGAERLQVEAVMAELVHHRGLSPAAVAAAYGVHRATVWRRINATRPGG